MKWLDCLNIAHLSGGKNLATDENSAILKKF